MRNEEPLTVAVVGRGRTETAQLLRRLTGLPVEKLTPCQAARSQKNYRAVVVENYDQPSRGLSGCAVARFTLADRTPITVVGLDEPEGQRMVKAMPQGVYAYSDGRPQANLTAKNVRLRGGKLEFEALTDDELMRVRVPYCHTPRLYDHLAAIAGALALGVPLAECVAKLNDTSLQREDWSQSDPEG